MRLISKVLLTMHSGSLVSSPSFPRLQLAISASNTAARSPKLASLFISFLGCPSRRVARVAAVPIRSDARIDRRFPKPLGNVYSRVRKYKEMNPYEKLDHEESAWNVCKTARFLGYHPKHIYRLIRQGKIEGWMRIDGK